MKRLLIIFLSVLNSFSLFSQKQNILLLSPDLEHPLDQSAKKQQGKATGPIYFYNGHFNAPMQGFEDAIKQKMDSAYYTSVNETGHRIRPIKWLITYNEKKLATQITMYQLFNSSTDPWKKQYMIERKYNANDSLVETINNYFDDATNQWHGQNKNEYTYNADKRLNSHTYYDFEESKNQWLNKVKMTYSYDNSRNSILKEVSSLNPGSGELENESRNRSIYDRTGHLIKEFDYIWNTTARQWSLYSKTEKQYNLKGDIIQSTNYTFKPDSPTVVLNSKDDAIGEETKWVARSKTLYVYNSNGKIAQRANYFRETDSLNWVGIDKQDYEYAENKNEMNCYAYLWNTRLKSWIYNSHAQYLFDTNDNPVESTMASWDSLEGNWLNIEKFEYVYSHQYAHNEIIIPDGFDMNFANNMLLEIKQYSWDKNSSSWNYEYHNTYYYSGFDITSATEFPRITAQVTPNPCTRLINVQIANALKDARFNLFDSSGTLLLSLPFKKNKIVSLEGLCQGNYVYQIISENKRIKSGILVKQ